MILIIEDNPLRNDGNNYNGNLKDLLAQRIYSSKYRPKNL